MLLPTFAGVLREKIRTRASFTKILANYASKESLIAAAYGENINWSDFSCKEVSGACKLWKKGSSIEFIWIYRVLDVAARAKWLHDLIHKASVSTSGSGFIDILIGCLDIGISSWSS